MKARHGMRHARPGAFIAVLSLGGTLAACGNDPAFTNHTTEITPERPASSDLPSKRDAEALGTEVDANAAIDTGSGGGGLSPVVLGDGVGVRTGAVELPTGSAGPGEGPGAGSAGGSGGGSGGSLGGAVGGSPIPSPTMAPSPQPAPVQASKPAPDSSDDRLSDSEASARDEAVDEVQAACASKPRVRKTVPLAFAKSAVDTKSICAWSSSPTNDVIRGYAVQTVPVALPAGALLCSSRISSDPKGTWVYDDEVVLTMNDVVLLASQKEYLRKDDANVMPRVGGGYGFEWAKLETLAYANRQSVESDRYCFGGPDARECLIPTSQQEGSVRLDLPAEALAPLALKARADKKVEFKLWVTGDNDIKIDCKHSGITLSGEFEYVMP